MSTLTGTGAGSGKPGPGLGPIVESAGAAHRAWLEPMRTAYFASGLSTEEICEKSRGAEGVKRLTSKGKVSELLRGAEEYPRWYRVHALYEVLAPSVPLVAIREKWTEGALAAGRSRDWTRKCFAEVRREPGAGDEKGGRGVLAKGHVIAAIISAVLALCASIVPSVFLSESSDVPGCQDGAVCGTGMPAPPDNSPGYRRYLRMPTPSDTRGLLKVTPWRDIPVYSADGTESPYWTMEGETFFVRCSTRSGFLDVAGTQWAVYSADVTLAEGASPSDVDALPRCVSLTPRPSP
ncbi:hypothetical protein [Streptomyces sp. Go-475]|uniref:hypothetical protein n=1 Tax=Streptomyces sp. Go-475 TaxID=2072505 RepID=UPI000DEF2F51|nr:hypothetical protein [Streptomyces sp. Go-475]AXE85741.1 hypothetical protein C1703_12070 [Streptomyces sp. Go-475]